MLALYYYFLYIYKNDCYEAIRFEITNNKVKLNVYFFIIHLT